MENCQHENGKTEGVLIDRCLDCNKPFKAEGAPLIATIAHMERLQDIYDFILDYRLDNKGVSPTSREVAEGCHLSENMAYRSILELHALGLIIKGPGARNIAIPGWSLYKDNLVRQIKP